MPAVSDLTLAELHVKHAQLTRQAAEVRGRWQDMSTGPRALAAGKRLRRLEQRIRDYDEIIKAVTQ